MGEVRFEPHVKPSLHLIDMDLH